MFTCFQPMSWCCFNVGVCFGFTFSTVTKDSKGCFASYLLWWRNIDPHAMWFKYLPDGWLTECFLIHHSLVKLKLPDKVVVKWIGSWLMGTASQWAKCPQNSEQPCTKNWGILTWCGFTRLSRKKHHQNILWGPTLTVWSNTVLHPQANRSACIAMLPLQASRAACTEESLLRPNMATD